MYKKAIVIYHTRFGNTEKIAKSIEIGLQEAKDIQTTVCKNVKGVNPSSLKEFDIICIDGPTEGFTASKPIRDFLRKLNGIDLSKKYGFAFDTELDSRLSGSAAKFIEKELANHGFKIIASRESAIVSTIKERGAIVGARLKEGEDKRFEQIGLRIRTIIRTELNSC